MNLQTTLNIIRADSPCGDRWAKLLESLPADIDHDTRIYFSHILESNGLSDAIWALRCVMPEEEKDRDREARLLACDYAKSVLHIYEATYSDDHRPRDCIEVARRFSSGIATSKELTAALTAARDARDDATAAAWAGAETAALAAALTAANDAARAAELTAGKDAARSAWGAASAALLAAKSDAESIQEAQFIARFCTEEDGK